jgi:queuine tRNA-ribosyltransferase
MSIQVSSGYLTTNIRLGNKHLLRKLWMKTSKCALSTHADPSTTIHVDYPGFAFHVNKVDSKSDARTCTIVTPHGNIETPNFIFCATKAAMKAVTTQQLRAENTQIMLSNTYHLMLQPGADIIEQLGGLQKMTGWNGPMLTDSGGYQIFSMGYGSVSNEIKGKRNAQQTLGKEQSLIEINEEGAKFRSYVDGSVHTLTPESSIQIQRKLGADIILVLDECTPFHVEKQYTKDSMLRSHRWAVRSLKEFARTQTAAPHKPPQALYGIIQGGIYPEYRKDSVSFANNNPFFGIAIGGSLGEHKERMYSIVKYTCELLKQSPDTYKQRPIHLLGIGGIRDIFHGVRQGIDTFDCVHPSRLGRHGGALVLKHYWDEDDMTLANVTSSTSAADQADGNMIHNHHIAPTMLEAITNKCEKLHARLHGQEMTYRQQLNITQMKLEILGSFDQSQDLSELQITRTREELQYLQLKMQEIDAHYEQLGYLAAFLHEQIRCYQRQLPTMAMTSSMRDHVAPNASSSNSNSSSSGGGKSSKSNKKGPITIHDIIARSSFANNTKPIPALWEQKVIDTKSPYHRYVKQLLNAMPQFQRIQQSSTSVPSSSGTSASNGTITNSIGGTSMHKRAFKQGSNKRYIREHMNLHAASMRFDTRPIDSTCSCYTCRNFSRGYLHHLFKAEESIGGTLVRLLSII